MNLTLAQKLVTAVCLLPFAFFVAFRTPYRRHFDTYEQYVDWNTIGVYALLR